MIPLDDVSKWSVLIVDDEPDNIDVVAVCLEFHKATIKRAENSKEAMSALQDALPTFILLDLTMPDIDGWEFHKRLRSDPATSHIPVIALTAHAMAGDEERVMAAGFDGYIAKPVDVLTFVDTVKTILAPLVAAKQETEKETEPAETQVKIETQMEAETKTETTTEQSASH